MWEPTLDTHAPPLPAPPWWKAGLPGAAVILLPGDLLPQLISFNFNFYGRRYKVAKEQGDEDF